MFTDLEKRRGVLAGKKTYIVAGLTIVGAIAAFLVGEAVPGAEETLSVPELIQLIVTSILAVTVRHSIKK